MQLKINHKTFLVGGFKSIRMKTNVGHILGFKDVLN